MIGAPSIPATRDAAPNFPDDTPTSPHSPDATIGHMPYDTNSDIYYELHGSGIPLLLGFPLMASQKALFGDSGEQVKQGYLDRLTDRFEVLCIDYPSIGQSGDIPVEDFTADRICRDLLSVADAAGFDRFAYWGYSFGAVAGLQLAWRTDRLTALVVGGWPPLGAQYDDILKAAIEQKESPPESAQVILRSPEQYAQWESLYNSIQGWPESKAAAELRCPGLAIAGENGDIDAGSQWMRNASILREKRATLEGYGWRVTLIPDRDFSVVMEPDAIVPPVRHFLDEVL